MDVSQNLLFILIDAETLKQLQLKASNLIYVAQGKTTAHKQMQEIWWKMQSAEDTQPLPLSFPNKQTWKYVETMW